MEGTSQAEPTRNSKVINCLYQSPDAVFKLICFPWAGGGSTYFARWGQMSPGLLEVHSIRLPGRESRYQEPFAKDINLLVDEVVDALLPIIQDKPFAFLGHSMGSYIALLAAMSLKEKHKLEPIHFFVSSTNPPHSKERRRLPINTDYTEEHMRGIFKMFGITTHHTLDEKELVEQSGPILLADAFMISNFFFDVQPRKPLSCDLTCFVGTEDIVKDIQDWKDLTNGKVDVHMRPGNHFYILEPTNVAFVQQYIIKCLELSMLTDY